MAIIGSLLNNDWYKFTMPPVVRKFYPNVIAGFSFTNRNTDFPVAKYVDIKELQDELAALRELRFTKQELEYLRSLGPLDPGYLEHLKNFRMPEVHTEVFNDQIVMDAQGIWDDVMPVEVPALQILTELVSRELAKEAGLGPSDIRREGYRHLDELVDLMRANPTKKLAPFGTRRHFSVQWEYEATAYLVYRIPNQIAGISNVALAREFGYPVAGTIAHEYFIIPTMIEIANGTENPIGVAQNQAMDHWETMYGDVWEGRILCAIPDTFGTDCFLRNFTAARALKWQVFKQDSGDPQVEVEKITSWLRDEGLNPALYRINHTDGLNLQTLSSLFEFADHHPSGYQDGYGLGTKHTNNVGVATHSFVWKPAWVMAGNEKVACVKLSNNLNKIVGYDPEMNQRVKELAGYTNTFAQVQTV